MARLNMGSWSVWVCYYSCFININYNGPCICWSIYCRDWWTANSESFCSEPAGGSQTGRRGKSFACSSTGAKDIVSGPALCYTEITLHGGDPCLAGLCKTLSHVLSLNILLPAYWISNLFPNLGFGNSNRFLSLKKNDIFVGERWSFLTFNLWVAQPHVVHGWWPVSFDKSHFLFGHLQLIRAAVYCRSDQ